jgi:hypothetical protein
LFIVSKTWFLVRLYLLYALAFLKAAEFSTSVGNHKPRYHWVVGIP